MRGFAVFDECTWTLELIPWTQFRRMMEKAKYAISRASFGIDSIQFPGIVKDWTNAFSMYDGQVFLYFNDRQGNTKTISEPLEK